MLTPCWRHADSVRAARWPCAACVLTVPSGRVLGTAAIFSHRVRADSVLAVSSAGVLAVPCPLAALTR